MAITFTFPFKTSSGAPSTGLSDVVVYITRVSDGVLVVNGSSATEIGSVSGKYKYTYSGASNSEDYVSHAYSASNTGNKYADADSGVVGLIQELYNIINGAIISGKVDVGKINGVSVDGAGTEGDPWGPA